MRTWFLCPSLRMRNVCRSPGESNWGHFQEFLSELRISALTALEGKSQNHFHWRQSVHSTLKHAIEPSQINVHRFSHLCCVSFLNNGADLNKAFYQAKIDLSGWALAAVACSRSRHWLTAAVLLFDANAPPSWGGRRGGFPYPCHWINPSPLPIPLAQLSPTFKGKYFPISFRGWGAGPSLWSTLQFWLEKSCRRVGAQHKWFLELYYPNSYGFSFFSVFISVFIAYIHQAVFKKSDVITFIIVRCGAFLVLHFIILCRQ